MTGRVVHPIWNAKRTRRVEVFQRGNGQFGFEEFTYGIEEQSWFPYGRRSESFTDSLEDAIREARDRVSWVAAEEENHK